MRAIDEARTRDLHLGKVAYYQLYYYRISIVPPQRTIDNIPHFNSRVNTIF